MSKTIDLQIEKCQTLIAGLRRNLGEVADKGINAGGLDELERNIGSLKEASQECDALRSALAEKVRNMNKILAAVKETFINTKKKIKSNYPQYDWDKFGVMDKR